MTLSLFLLGLLIVSVFTTLFVQGIKSTLDELGKKYYSNLLAGGVSLVLSALVGVCYALIKNLAFDAAYVVYLIALMALSWLSAMVGYDKVIQAITQIRSDD